jgi:hypothetical protein
MWLNPPGSGPVPAWDGSLNYVPVPFPNYPAAVIEMKPSQKEFWRVANASADTIMDLQLKFDGVAQPLQIVALDGVPTGSQDGTRSGKLATKSDILIPPAGRIEFIVSGPSVRVKHSTFLTLAIDTGPGSDNDPQRPLASIHPPVRRRGACAGGDPGSLWQGKSAAFRGAR